MQCRCILQYFAKITPTEQNNLDKLKIQGMETKRPISVSLNRKNKNLCTIITQQSQWNKRKASWTNIFDLKVTILQIWGAGNINDRNEDKNSFMKHNHIILLVCYKNRLRFRRSNTNNETDIKTLRTIQSRTVGGRYKNQDTPE